MTRLYSLCYSVDCFALTILPVHNHTRFLVHVLNLKIWGFCCEKNNDEICNISPSILLMIIPDFLVHVRYHEYGVSTVRKTVMKFVISVQVSCS